MCEWKEDESEPVPAWLNEAIDVLMRDLQKPHSIPVTIGFETQSQTLWVREQDVGGARFDFALWGREETPVELIATLAHWLQEQFFWESAGAWAEARPACPGHTHPAVADEIDGEAWWTCPRDHHPIAIIGRLGE